MGQKYYDKTAEKLSKANELIADKQTKKDLELVERPVIDDKKINVLVMGVSGAGKSTLINSVLGEEKAKVGDGEAITQKMRIYEKEDVMFRMVDTVGLEYNFMRQQKILNELSQWSEDGLSRKNLAKLIHCIWFCIDAQSKRVPKESLNYLYKISKMWTGVPIIVVFTKSYSTKAIAENEEMFWKVMKKYQKKKKLNVCNVVSLLAKEFVVDDDITLKNYGVEKLVELTSDLMPKAKEINEEVMTNWSFRMRKNAAKKYIKAARRSAFTVTIMPTKGDDAQFIENIWENMFQNIAKSFVLDEADEAKMREKVNKAIKYLKYYLSFTKLLRVVNAFLAFAVTDILGDIASDTAEDLHKAKKKAEKKASLN